MFLSRNKKTFKKEKSQAAIEYLVLFTAVITLLIVFLGSKTSFFAQSYNRSLQRASNSIEVRAMRIINKAN